MFVFPIDNPDSSEYLAEWIELFVVLNSDVSKAEVRSFVSRWLGDDPGEEFIDGVWIELEKRLFLYGENPPFVMKEMQVISTIDSNKNPEYLMCLLLSMLGNSDRPVETGKLFERLSGEAIRNYVGGEVIVYGFPSKHNLEDVASRLGERHNFSPPPHFKDRGVDVIAWKSFRDDRPGQIVILLQSAAGLNWKSKLLEIPYRAWCKYIAWGCDPLLGFSVPCIIHKEDFEENAFCGGILIDRTRIYRNTFPFEFSDDLRDRLRDWCDTKLPELIEST